MSSQALQSPVAQKTIARPLQAVEAPERHLYALPSLYTRAAKQQPAAADIPPPNSLMIQKLAIYGYEVLDGSRGVTQLGGWITREVAEHLGSRRAARTERRTLYSDDRRLVPIPGRVHLSQVSERVAEATVVLSTEVRSTAVAIRLEFLHQRWRATNLTVL